MAHPILDAECFPGQREFVNSNERFAWCVAPSRTGKTQGAAFAFVRRVLKDYRIPQFRNPSQPLRYWCVGPTYEQTIAQKERLQEPLKLITDDMVDWGKQGNDDRWRDLRHGGGKVWLVGNRLIDFKTADSPEGLVADAVRGAWITEVARIPEAAWINIRARLANADYPSGPATRWAIGDTTPYGRGWFFEQVVVRAKAGDLPNTGLYGWPAGRSPHVPQEEIEQARATLPDLFFRREYMAEWVAMEGSVFSDFDDKLNTVVPADFPATDAERVKAGWDRYLAADLNSASEKPACYSECWHHRDTDRIHVAREMAAYVGIDLIEYPEVLVKEARRVKDTVVCVDPSIRNEIKTAIQRGGVECVDGISAEDAGVRRLATMVKTRRLTVSADCHETIKQFFATVWTANADKKGLYHIDKKKCDPHYIDGIRYLALWTERNVVATIKRWQPFGPRGPQVAAR